MDRRLFVAEEGYDRVDVFLSAMMEDVTRSRIKKLCDDGNVLLAGEPVKASRGVGKGQAVEVILPTPVALDLAPENIPLDIVYEDEDMAVINKQRGLTVHAGHGNENGTLVNGLLFHLKSLSGINGVLRPGIVHRIDKDTTGLLVVAKNDTAHVSLAGQIAEKTAHREYLALLEGVVKTDGGRIETKIDRSQKDRTMMAVSSTGRVAVTDYEVVQRFTAHTLCRFILQTGRTHQIRVHAKHLGHPVVGDKVYGYKKQRFALDGQLLHAFRLTLTHPRTGEQMTFSAPLPQDYEKVLETLRRETKGKTV